MTYGNDDVFHRFGRVGYVDGGYDCADAAEETGGAGAERNLRGTGLDGAGGHCAAVSALEILISAALRCSSDSTVVHL